MKKLILSLIAFTLMLQLFSKEYEVLSPNQSIKLVINVDETISWSAYFGGQVAIEKAEINMKLEQQSFGVSSKLKKSSARSINENIVPIVPHKDALIPNVCNERSFVFKQDFELVFRVYNDGVAYQFRSTLNKPDKVWDEKMNITFPENSTSLFPQEESMYSHNERFYLNKKFNEITSDDFCSLPVLFKTASNINVLFTETALHDYPCMFLQGDGDNSLQTKFPKFVLEAVPNMKDSPDRNQLITKEAVYIAEFNGPKNFPWRVFIINNNDKELVESNLAYQLANPTGIERTDWIKPGKVAWDWYNANNIYGVDFESGINQKTYQYYIDFASENGIEYVILDEGWTKSTTEIMESNSEIDIEKLFQYAKEKNVGIILWVLWKPLNDNMTEILEKYKSWGAVGIKVDFMQRSDQAMVKSYEEIAKECARLEMLVDFHGAFKPAGLRRVYPNIINYEGVKGSENNKWSDEITPEHNVTIPFIRMAAGPLDYTPGCMNNASLKDYKISHFRPMSLGTRCHQLAMYVVFEAPLQMLCENPSTYKKEQECVDFMVKIPTIWDETVVLEGKVGDYIIVARRKGENWYIGGMTDWEAREFTLELPFLKGGEYNMEVMQDGINADKFAQDYKKLNLQVNIQTKIEIKMASGGGWAAILSKVSK